MTRQPTTLEINPEFMGDTYIIGISPRLGIGVLRIEDAGRLLGFLGLTVEECYDLARQLNETGDALAAADGY